MPASMNRRACPWKIVVSDSPSALRKGSTQLLCLRMGTCIHGEVRVQSVLVTATQTSFWSRRRLSSRAAKKASASHKLRAAGSTCWPSARMAKCGRGVQASTEGWEQ